MRFYATHSMPRLKSSPHIRVWAFAIYCSPLLIKTEMHIPVHCTLNLRTLIGKRLMGLTLKAKAIKTKAKDKHNVA